MVSLFMAILAAGVIGGLDHNVVTPEWLEQNLDDPYVVVVEVGSAPLLDRRHIPGARFLAIETIVEHDGWPPDELPPVDELRKAMEYAGIGDDGRIVLYSSNPLYATRAWFTLDYLGHGDRTVILDGGYQRWIAERRPVATKRFAYLGKTFTPWPDQTRLVSHREMRRAVRSGAVLIDARPVPEFYGLRRGRSVVRRGHIPGAECQPWQSNLHNGSFRPAATLEDLYARTIPDPDTRVIVYCRTGIEASMPYFVLRSLGYDVALYDGSFAEWARDRSAPVARLSSPF